MPVFPDFSKHRKHGEDPNDFCLHASVKSKCDGRNRLGLEHYKLVLHREQEPWRLPSRQAEFNGTNRLRFDVHSDDQEVTGNQGYFED